MSQPASRPEPRKHTLSGAFLMHTLSAGWPKNRSEVRPQTRWQKCCEEKAAAQRAWHCAYVCVVRAISYRQKLSVTTENSIFTWDFTQLTTTSVLEVTVSQLRSNNALFLSMSLPLWLLSLSLLPLRLLVLWWLRLLISLALMTIKTLQYNFTRTDKQFTPTTWGAFGDLCKRQPAFVADYPFPHRQQSQECQSQLLCLGLPRVPITARVPGTSPPRRGPAWIAFASLNRTLGPSLSERITPSSTVLKATFCSFPRTLFSCWQCKDKPDFVIAWWAVSDAHPDHDKEHFVMPGSQISLAFHFFKKKLLLEPDLSPMPVPDKLRHGLGHLVPQSVFRSFIFTSPIPSVGFLFMLRRSSVSTYFSHHFFNTLSAALRSIGNTKRARAALRLKRRSLLLMLLR